MPIEMPLTGHLEKTKKSDTELFLKTIEVLNKKHLYCAEVLVSLSDEERSDIENGLNLLGYSWAVFNVVDAYSSVGVTKRIKEFQETQDKDIRKKIISGIVDFLE